MVLQQDVDFLTPYSVEYDSEEETLNLPQDNYEYLMNVASAKVSVYVSSIRSVEKHDFNIGFILLILSGYSVYHGLQYILCRLHKSTERIH
jgi:hypothetical protein